MEKFFSLFSMEHFTLIPNSECQNHTMQLETFLSNRYNLNSSLKVCIQIWPTLNTTSCTNLVTIKMEPNMMNFPNAPFQQTMDVITTYQQDFEYNWNR